LSIFESLIEMIRKAEKTEQSNIERPEPMFNSIGTEGSTEAGNQKSYTPTLLERYIAGWRRHDMEAIIETLTTDCIVIECFGPIYYGHEWVKRWISAWLYENGCVIDWTIQNLKSLGNVETAEWTFSYTWRGEEKSFDGITIAKLHEGKISHLREYATTAPLYDWQGEWRPL